MKPNPVTGHRPPSRHRCATLSSRETRAGAHLQALLVVAWLCLCSVLPAGAQVSGYLYVTMLSGYNLVANPFNARIGAAIDNSLTNVLRRVPDGTYAYAWDSGSQSFRGAIYSTNTGWSTSFDLPPSAGFVIKANSRWTNIFAGLVPTGTTNITILGGNKFSLVASYLYLAQPASLSALDFPKENCGLKAIYGDVRSLWMAEQMQRTTAVKG